MDLENGGVDLEDTLQRLHFFYKDSEFSIESIQKEVLRKKIICLPTDFITYLQTALLDEKLIEIRFDDCENLYFTKIIDNQEEELSSTSHPPQDDNPMQGGYLSNFTHITTLPLEPGIGNYHIRNSQKILMRMFTKSFAFEFGTYFKGVTSIEGEPALNFNYPVIGRHLQGAREYRAKVVEELDLHAIIVGKRKQSDIHTKPIDISASGIAISLKKQDVKHFLVGEQRKLTITDGDQHTLKVTGKVVHITAVRKHHGVIYLCGLQLELFTRETTRKLESLVGYVQRAHLQSISGLSRETGCRLIV